MIKLWMNTFRDLLWFSGGKEIHIKLRKNVVDGPSLFFFSLQLDTDGPNTVFSPFPGIGLHRSQSGPALLVHRLPGQLPSLGAELLDLCFVSAKAVLGSFRVEDGGWMWDGLHRHKFADCLRN